MIARTNIEENMMAFNVKISIFRKHTGLKLELKQLLIVIPKVCVKYMFD